MVSGTLALKNGYYYAVLSYRDAAGKLHQKWVSTGLPQKGNKCRAEQELIRIRSEFEIPPDAGELNSNMLFADYLDQWLENVRARIKPATFGSYQGMVKSTIGPYFRKKELTLKELEARHIQHGEAENRYAEFSYPLSCGDLPGFEVCDENRHGTAECCHEGG